MGERKTVQIGGHRIFSGRDEAVRRVRATGFTLIELLVVVFIIALLLAILLPSLGMARLLARRVNCSANFSAIGKAAGMYRFEYNDYVPVAWQNWPETFLHPWKSWRTNLLPYTNGYTTFNCPGIKDVGGTELFRSNDDVTTLDNYGTANAGSYGIMSQNSLPSFQAMTYYSNTPEVGHPVKSDAYPAQAGAAWRNPEQSIYVADAYFARGPMTYPSKTYNGWGTSIIYLPSEADYIATDKNVRRFADRHLGTAALFVDGHVEVYETEELDAMEADSPGCIWDVE